MVLVMKITFNFIDLNTDENDMRGWYVEAASSILCKLEALKRHFMGVLHHLGLAQFDLNFCKAGSNNALKPL